MHSRIFMQWHWFGFLKASRISFTITFCVQRSAVSQDDHTNDNPKRTCVDRVPQHLLPCRYTRRTENDEGSCGACMHQLGKQYTLRVGIDPSDQNSHGRHRCDKCEEITQPICAVWGCGTEVIDHRPVPDSPQ